jgi:hypothetical protein
MRYFANPSTRSARDAMSAGLLDTIVTPAQGNAVPAGATYCADNGVYGDGYPGDTAWLAWLRNLPTDRCRFAVAPDVVADAAATIARSRPLLPVIRAAGYPPAYVAQDGQENLPIPWPDFDALFIGGSTGWKLGAAARDIAADARRRGKWLHMGRVNSGRRMRYARYIGCDSVDGTYLTFGPDTNLPTLLAWLREDAHPALWETT